MFFNRKILFGIILGIFSTLAVIWIYRTLLMDKSTKYSINISSIDSTNNAIDGLSIIKELESTDNTIERISSLNKRLDDILIFGGVIVTLLLAISVGVYIRAESEVDRHFKDNFDSISKRAKEYETKLEQVSSKAQTELSLLTEMRMNAEKQQMTTP